MKTPVIYAMNYTIYLENYVGNSFIHCDCYKWTKAIKLAMLQDVDTLLQIHRKPLLAIHEIDDKKHLKFLSLLGFSYHSNFEGMDNTMRQLYVKEFKTGDK